MDGMLTSDRGRRTARGQGLDAVRVREPRPAGVAPSARRPAQPVPRRGRRAAGASGHGADDRSSPAWPWSPRRSPSCAPTGPPTAAAPRSSLGRRPTPEDGRRPALGRRTGRLGARSRSTRRPALAPRDRMPWTVVMVGAQDPLRSDLRPGAVVRAARRLISTLATGARRRNSPPTRPWRSGWRRPARGATPTGPRWSTRSGRPWCCWPTTSWPRRPWRSGSPRRPGPTSTTPCSPGSARWRDRCTARPAAWCSTCCAAPAPTVPAPALDDAAALAGGWCPASATAPTRRVTRAARPCSTRCVAARGRRAAAPRSTQLRRPGRRCRAAGAEHRPGPRRAGATAPTWPAEALPLLFAVSRCTGMGRPLPGGAGRGAAALPRPGGARHLDAEGRLGPSDVGRSGPPGRDRARGSGPGSLRTSPNRSSPPFQSSTAATISLAGAADEVPPHLHRRLERVAADQQPPGRPVGRDRRPRRRRSAGTPARRRPSGRAVDARSVPRPRPRRARSPGRAAAPVGPAAVTEQLDADQRGVGARRGAHVTEAHRAARWRCQRRRSPWWAARRGARTRGRRDGSTRAGRPRTARRASGPGRSAGVCSAWAMPWPAVIRLSWPGRIGCSEPRLSVCTAMPSTSQVTVDSPQCGCGPTPSPSSAPGELGPKWSTKHQAPIGPSGALRQRPAHLRRHRPWRCGWGDLHPASLTVPKNGTVGRSVRASPDAHPPGIAGTLGP